MVGTIRQLVEIGSSGHREIGSSEKQRQQQNLFSRECTRRNANQCNCQLPDALLLPAILTQAVNLEGMAGGVKVIFAANILFQFAYFRRKELHRNAALGTYHVMVAAAVELVLITGHAVMKGHNAGQAALCQQLERAIYGGESDLRIFLAGEAEELVCRKVVAGLQKGAE